MRIRLTDLRTVAPTKPEGYLSDVMSKGKLSGDFLEISPQDYAALRQKYSPQTELQVTSGGCCGKSATRPTASLQPSASFPPLMQQLRNAAGAATRVASNIIHGKPLTAEDDVIAKRKEICNACEFFKNGRCLHCGCYLSSKQRLSSESCPVGKW